MKTRPLSHFSKGLAWAGIVSALLSAYAFVAGPASGPPDIGIKYFILILMALQAWPISGFAVSGFLSHTPHREIHGWALALFWGWAILGLLLVPAGALALAISFRW